MSTLLLNRNSKVEYHIHLEKPEDPNLQIIYQGHKLAISESMLDDIIWYKYEVSTGKIFCLRYDIWLEKYNCETPSNLQIDLWKPCNLQSKQKELFETWGNILQLLRKKHGNFSTIYISKINI